MIELVKSEGFRNPILDALELKASQTPTDYVNLRFIKFINDLQKPIHYIIIFKNFPMLDIIRQGWSIFHLNFINWSGRHERNKHASRHSKGIDKMIFYSRDI